MPSLPTRIGTQDGAKLSRRCARIVVRAGDSIEDTAIGADLMNPARAAVGSAHDRASSGLKPDPSARICVAAGDTSITGARGK